MLAVDRADIGAVATAVQHLISEAETGAKDAMSRLGDTVHGPEADGLSPIDKTCLLTMIQDDGTSSTSTIAERMGKDVKYAGIYRVRLIEAQVIEDCGYGKVNFAISHLREYLRERGIYPHAPWAS